MIEEIHNRAEYIRKEEELGKCKESSSRIQRKAEYRSKKIREVRNSREKKLWKERVIRKVYNKDVIWMG